MIRLAIVLAVDLVLSACATIVTFRPEPNKMSSHIIKNGSAALVVDPARLQAETNISVDSQLEILKEMPAKVQSALKHQLELSGNKVEVVNSLSAPGFDFYVRPTFGMQQVGYKPYACLVNYRVEVFAKNGELLARISDEAKRKFMWVGEAENACEGSFNLVIPSVNERAVGPR